MSSTTQPTTAFVLCLSYRGSIFSTPGGYSQPLPLTPRGPKILHFSFVSCGYRFRPLGPNAVCILAGHHQNCITSIVTSPEQNQRSPIIFNRAALRHPSKICQITLSGIASIPLMRFADASDLASFRKCRRPW